MKHHFCFFVTLLLVHLNLSAQTKISGIVKDQETKEPLQGASIFAPNTTNGGSTDDKGFFSFTMFGNQNEVIISYVGYESVLVPAASLSDPTKSNTILLTPAVNNLKEVVIRKISAKDRARYMAIFNRGFIGFGTIAENTKILNPEVLQFDMNSDNTLLIVSADEPIQMINKKTGYQISYELVYFENKVTSQENNEQLTTYFGYPFFKDIVAEKKLDPKKTAQTRLKCYRGSTMHFIRSLHNGTMEKEGFTVRKFKREKIPHVPVEYKDVYEKNDCMAHQLVFERENKKYFYFTDFISVHHPSEEHKKLQCSQLKLLVDKPIEIYADGNYADPDTLANFGYMGWQKMGEMLPFDYQPEKVVTE